MKARILPLKGKYYGTEIEIEFNNEENPQPEWGNTTSFKLWFSRGNPSTREINSWGFTREQWINNELVDDGWEEKSPIQELGMLCDSHYESEITYNLALKIVKAINEQTLLESIFIF